MNIEIRNARQGDEKIFAYIQTESWKQAFKDIISEETMTKHTDLSSVEAMYKRVISNPAMYLKLQIVDGKPHCISAWGTNREDSNSISAELICLHSLPDKRRQGLGTIMMEATLKDIENASYSEVILWCFEENTVARKFYKKMGFVCTGKTKNTFGATEVEYKLNLKYRKKQ